MAKNMMKENVLAYTPTYIRSSVAAVIGASRKDNYRMLMMSGRGIPPRLATNGDVTDGDTPEPGGKAIPLTLSQPASQHGYDLLYLGPQQSYIDVLLNAYLKSVIYRGDSLFDLYKLPLLFGLVSLVIQLPFSIAKDVQRRKQLRYGRRLKGPEMMTPREFNARVEGDGIGIKTDGMNAMIRIPMSGNRACARAAPATTSNSEPSGPISRIASARTSAG